MPYKLRKNDEHVVEALVPFDKLTVSPGRRRKIALDRDFGRPHCPLSNMRLGIGHNRGRIDFRQFGAVAAETFGLVERLVCRGDEIAMLGFRTGHQRRDADAQFGMAPRLDLVRAAAGDQILTNLSAASAAASPSDVSGSRTANSSPP